MPPFGRVSQEIFSQHSVKFDEAKRHAVYARDGYKCAYCGHHDATKSGGGMSIDHIQSRESGGAAQNTKGSPATNLITTCGSCNYSKQAKDPRQFNAYLKANGVGTIDWTKVRTQAGKKIDIKTGEGNAAAAKAYRDSAKGATQAPSDQKTPDAAAPKVTSPQPGGPGVQHGDDGKFLPGSRRVAFARAIEASVEGDAPDAGRLWRAGWNATDKGDLNLTPESMRLIIADQAARGNPLVWYYEHEDTVPLAQRGGTPMKGVCSAPSSIIEARGPATAPECWAAQIAWTDEARRQITSGERRQLSPIAAYDEETREIVAIRNVSLCAEGATHHGTLLASREGKGSMDEIKQQIMDAINAGDWEAAEALIAQAEGMEGAGDMSMVKAAVGAAKMKAATPPPPAPAGPVAPVKKMAAMSREQMPAGVNVDAFNRVVLDLQTATDNANAAARDSRRATVETLIATNRPLFDVIDEREHIGAADPAATRRHIASVGRKVAVMAASKGDATKVEKPEAKPGDPKKGAVVETFGLSEIEMGQASASGITFKAFAEARDRQATKPRRGGQPVGQA